MSELTLYLLRHGESEANVGRVFAARKVDPPLTAEGIRQAEAQGEFLKSVGLTAIHASTLLRARQTAEVVSRHCELDVCYHDALREVHVGVLDGESQNDPEKWALHETVKAQWEQGVTEAGYPGGESLAEVGERFLGFVNGLDGNGESRILIVGHYLLFAAVVWLFCEDRAPTFTECGLNRGHMSIIRRKGDGFRIVQSNVLAGKGPAA
jgi:broad specificity phosphatase PhoE